MSFAGKVQVADQDYSFLLILSNLDKTDKPIQLPSHRKCYPLKPSQCTLLAVSSCIWSVQNKKKLTWHFPPD